MCYWKIWAIEHCSACALLNCNDKLTAIKKGVKCLLIHPACNCVLTNGH